MAEKENIAVENTQSGQQVAAFAEVWPTDVYTFAEAARRLRVSYHTIYRLAARGKIKTCTYVRGMIPAAEVERLLRGD